MLLAFQRRRCAVECGPEALSAVPLHAAAHFLPPPCLGVEVLDLQVERSALLPCMYMRTPGAVAGALCLLHLPATTACAPAPLFRGTPL
jgi:hypothetical protein